MSSHSERQSGHKLNDSCFRKTLNTQVMNILSKNECNLHLSILMMSSFSKSQRNDRFIQGAYNFLWKFKLSKVYQTKRRIALHKAMLL